VHFLKPRVIKVVAPVMSEAAAIELIDLLKSDKDTSGNHTRQWIKITTDVLVMPSNLLGVNSIKLLKSRFKVKFK
jgi:hypothetical protein